MSDFKGLRTIVYMVTDMTKAVDWYSKAFETKPYYDTPYYAGFNIGGYELGVHPDATPTEQKTTNVQGYWGVDDVPASLEKLQALGATLHQEPQDVGEGIILGAVKDPWGNIIGVIYNPHFKVQD